MTETDRSRSDAAEIPFATFVLERRLAVGGMSEVFLARSRDDAAGTKVVLKRILPDLVEDDGVRETFELEAKLHRSVHHPSVVSFYEFGTYAGEPYIVMEHVDGCDLSRVMKRSRTESKPVDPGTCVYVARRLCDGLAAVHDLCDEHGKPLGVVHRDVTPSNVLLSKKGEVKLGDFGIAHVTRAVLTRTSLALRGKYAYLAPEQVSGEAFDHRADLFSVAVVLAEALIGGPLFPGAGQLAVLLSIRDARLDALRAARDRMPSALFDVLAHALSKLPEDRFSSAHELSEALRPFQSNAKDAMNDLASWVAYTSDHASAARSLRGAVQEVLAATSKTSSSDAMPAVLRPNDRPSAPPTITPTGAEPEKAAAPATPDSKQDAPPSSVSGQRTSHPDDKVACFVRIGGKASARAVHLAKLIEMLATGQVTAEDEVDFGDGFHRVSSITMLSRYIPPATQTTRRLDGPGVPDFIGSLPESSIADALAWIVRHLDSGVLFAQPKSQDQAHSELYFTGGKLVLAVSNEPAMLLGERLVSKGIIQRGELELAVLVMHRYNGQLGDTLVGLGLADPVEVFQALRAQGRERVSGLFKWTQGQFTFYRGIDPARVDFRLDLDVPGLLLAGLAEMRSSDELVAAWTPRLDERLHPTTPKPLWAKSVTWPNVMLTVLRELSGGASVREVIASLGPRGSRGKAAFSKVHVLLALETCDKLGLVSKA